MLNLATIRDLFDVRTITQTELPELPEYQISMMIMLECRLLQIKLNYFKKQQKLVLTFP